MSDKIIYLLISSGVALSGIIIKYWLDKRASKKSDFSKAVVEFKAAFTDEIIKLERPYQSIEADRAFIIVRNAAAKHRNAWLKFRRYLGESKRDAFDAAWKEYEGENKYDGVHDVAKAKRQLALDRIKKLLEFAE